MKQSEDWFCTKAPTYPALTRYHWRDWSDLYIHFTLTVYICRVIFVGTRLNPLEAWLSLREGEAATISVNLSRHFLLFRFGVSNLFRVISLGKRQCKYVWMTYRTTPRMYACGLTESMVKRRRLQEKKMPKVNQSVVRYYYIDTLRLESRVRILFFFLKRVRGGGKVLRPREN